MVKYYIILCIKLILEVIMFKLTFSPASPYVRKVLLSAYRAGIQDELELVEAGSENDTLLRGKNPVSYTHLTLPTR